MGIVTLSFLWARGRMTGTKLIKERISTLQRLTIVLAGWVFTCSMFTV